MARLAKRSTLWLVLALTLSACAPAGVGRTPSSMPEGRWVVADEPRTAPQRLRGTPPHYAALHTSTAAIGAGPAQYAALVHPAVALPSMGSDRLDASNAASLSQRPPLSPGDRVRIAVAEGEEFSGIFELDIDGSLNLPFLPPIQAAGHSVTWTGRAIEAALINAGFFRPALVQVTVRTQQWAPVQVHVSGAVFSPGMVTVNARDAEERTQKSTQLSGDLPLDRMLPAALRAAGGVRPDADVSQVLLIRDGAARVVDLSGHLVGLPVQAIALMAGDTLIVPTSGRYDEALIKPSAITPPGVRVFMSNLTVPATDNSRSAINQASTSLPYGTRMLTALISSNCVGGTAATNSARYAVLVTHNPLSGEQEVIQRSIEDLLRHADHEDFNPMIMPNDGLACFDSGVTNVRDIARTLVDIALPFRIGSLLGVGQ